MSRERVGCIAGPFFASSQVGKEPGEIGCLAVFLWIVFILPLMLAIGALVLAVSILATVGAVLIAVVRRILGHDVRIRDAWLLVPRLLRQEPKPASWPAPTGPALHPVTMPEDRDED